MSEYTEFFSWGSDSHGQLALAGTMEGQNMGYFSDPRTLSFDVIIKSISCGDYHACFITSDGLAFAIGSNEEG